MAKRCHLCERGFQTKDGYHVPSQRLGMIPVTICEKRRKEIERDAKINAYNDAIAALENLESDSDTPADKEARQWLADKLDKECDRLVRRASTTVRPR